MIEEVDVSLDIHAQRRRIVAVKQKVLRVWGSVSDIIIVPNSLRARSIFILRPLKGQHLLFLLFAASKHRLFGRRAAFEQTMKTDRTDSFGVNQLQTEQDITPCAVIICSYEKKF